MSLWWLQPGWDEAICQRCGSRIWPDGDPDWGVCYACFSADLEEQQQCAEEAKRYEQEIQEQP